MHRTLLLLLPLLLIACNQPDTVGDTDGGDPEGGSLLDAGDGDVCASAAPGETCDTTESCGGPCDDPCSFCNVLSCEDGQWRGVEAAPYPCDDDNPDITRCELSGGTWDEDACGHTFCGTTDDCVGVPGCLCPNDAAWRDNVGCDTALCG